MATDRARLGPSEPSLSPELIAQRGFLTSRRGFDPAEVKAFLAQVADELRARRHHEAALERALAEAEERAAHPSFDQDTLMSAVGEETASILRSAHAAAADIRAKAEDNAARILKEAHDRSSAMLEEAEAVLGRRTAEAEAQAARITEVARADTERARDAVRQEAEALRSQIEAERKLTMEAAQGARERILGDLTRRRKVAMVQIEQLRAGRERLLEAYKVVRRTLDEVTGELQRADSAARAAAEAAGHRPLPPDGDDLEVVMGGAALGVPAVASTPEPPAADAVAGEPAGAEHPDAPPTAGAAGGSDGAEDGGPPVPSDPEPPGSGPAVAVPARAAATEPEPADSPEAPPGPVAETDPTGGPVESMGSGAGKAGPAPRSGGRAVEERRLSSLRVLRRQKDPKESSERPSAPPRPTNGEVAGAVDFDRAARVADATDTAGRADADPAPEAVTGETKDRSGSVEGLFARIRAGREQAVADARQVLADPPNPDESEQQADGGSHLEAEAEGTRPHADLPRVPAEDEAVLQRRDEAVGPIETTLSRRLKRALQDEQNDLLDRLRGLRTQPTAALVLPAQDAHAERFADAGRPSLDKAAKAGAAFAIASLRPGLSPAAAATEMPDTDDLATELAAAVVDPLRRRLEQAFTDGGAEDQSVLVESLGAAYREWKTQRIEELASDHVAQAFVRGAFGATPEGTRLRWLVEDVNGPCPDCDDNALAGGLVKGEPFPTGQQFPPAHAGCRCLLVPEPAQT